MRPGNWRQKLASGAARRMRRLFLPLLALITLWPTHALQDNCRGVCGRRPLAPSHASSKLTGGGVDVLPGSWPWMVSIRAALNSGYQHTCGGSLISARWILTAAHCFNETRNPTNWQLVLGASELSRPGPDAQVRFPRRMVKHENYQPQQQINDIALVELDNPVQCSDYIQPACLPDSSANVSAMTHCYIAGWGYTQEKSQAPSDILKEAKVDLIPTEICNASNWYYGNIRGSNLCAGFEGGGIDSCQGDSGGPLMCREDRSERFWVVGITSWGSGCARVRSPGVYTSTQHFDAWIQAFVREQYSLLPDLQASEPSTSTTQLPESSAEPQASSTAPLPSNPMPPRSGSLRNPRVTTLPQPASYTAYTPPTTMPWPPPSLPPPPPQEPPRRKETVVSSATYTSSWHPWNTRPWLKPPKPGLAR